MLIATLVRLAGLEPGQDESRVADQAQAVAQGNVFSSHQAPWHPGRDTDPCDWSVWNPLTTVPTPAIVLGYGRDPTSAVPPPPAIVRELCFRHVRVGRREQLR